MKQPLKLRKKESLYEDNTNNFDGSNRSLTFVFSDQVVSRLDKIHQAKQDVKTGCRKVSDLKILIAGIGNIFNGDDGFGVEVVRELNERALPDGVEVADFGIRSFDLAFALVNGYRAVILVDALQRNQAPGTLYLFEPNLIDAEELMPVAMEGHGLHPAQVLKLARLYGTLPDHIFLVGCEPLTVAFSDEGQLGLSPPVQANLEEAIKLIESLLQKLQQKFFVVNES